MRRQIVSVAAVASLALAVVSSTSAQVVAPPPAQLLPLTRPAPTAWSGDTAVALLRDALGHRQVTPDLLDEPMVADRFHPDGPRPDRPCRPDAACGTWEVVTTAGRWWVYASGAVQPADSTAWAIERRTFGDDD
jgi:hypothetical protein